MRQYKHYSFDLWDTLIKGNHKMVIARDQLTFKLLLQHGYKNIPLGDIQQAYIKVKALHDTVTTVAKKCWSPEQLFTLVLRELHVSVSDSAKIVPLLHIQNNEQFLQILPTVYSPMTISVLKALKSSGSTLSLLCNTGYVGGETLSLALNLLGLKEYFNVMYFSDQYNWAKPDTRFFKLTESCQLFHNKKVEYHDILHVGDNIETDGVGALESGYHYMQVHTNDKSLLDLITK